MSLDATLRSEPAGAFGDVPAIICCDHDPLLWTSTIASYGVCASMPLSPLRTVDRRVLSTRQLFVKGKSASGKATERNGGGENKSTVALP